MSLIGWWPLNGDLRDLSPYNRPLKNGFKKFSNYRYGDANMDGVIDQTDAQTALKIFSGEITPTEEQKMLADVSQDGKINANDAKLILQYVNGKIKSLIGTYPGEEVQPTWGDGKLGRYAWYCTSKDDKTEPIILDELKGTRTMSCTCWVKINSIINDFLNILTFTDNEKHQLRLESTTGSGLKWFANSFLSNSSGLNYYNPGLGNWVHVGFCIDGNKSYLYINGKLNNTRTIEDTYKNNGLTFSGEMWLGQGDSGSSYYFDGAIQNLKVYNHILSKEEVKQDYLNPMLHYTFEDSYAQETENIQHKLSIISSNGANITSGSDDKGNYFIKTPRIEASPNSWANGISLKFGDNIVYGGNYYTWSIEVNPTTDLTLDNNLAQVYSTNHLMGDSPLKCYFDRNISPPSGWVGNDIGCPIVDTYLGSIPKNKWTRIWLTCYIEPEIGKATLFHCFCPNCNTESQIKVYYRNSQLEKGRFMTPLIPIGTKRVIDKIRDNSGMSNDGTIMYKREEISSNIPKDKVYTFNSYTGIRNESKTLGLLNHNSRYFYLNSVISYEFDIKLENIVKKTENGIPYCHIGGATIKTDGTSYWSDGAVAHPGGGPVQMTNITSRLNNLENGTYHITIEKKIIDPDSIANASSYQFNLVFGYITGKVTVSNVRFYYQNLDTSRLGIQDRNNAIGTKSAYFNGKSCVNCGVVGPNIMEELTASCWIYKEDWTKPIDTGKYTAILSSRDNGGYCFDLSGTNNKLLSFYFKYNTDDNVRTGYFDTTTFTNGWHLITGTVSSVKISLYIDGKLYSEVNNSGHTINNLYKNDVSKARPYLLIGSELDYWDKFPNYTLTNIEDVYIDDVRLYATALSTEDVEDLYRCKVKVDRDGNVFTNQLVETKGENRFPISDPTLIQNSNLYMFWSDGIFTREDKILTYTFTRCDLNVDYNGFYIGAGGYGGAIQNNTNRRYKWSCNVKVSKDSVYLIGEEREGYLTISLKAGRWYHLERENYSIGVNGSFTFYQNKPEVGDKIQVKDLCIYELDDKISLIETSVVPKITKKAELKCFELDETNLDRFTNYKIVEKYGAKWLKVFHHNTNNNTEWFKNEAEALHCNTRYKYSILDELEYFKGSDGKFEFLLEYEKDFPNQYNRWKQTDNPVTTEEISNGGTTKANGYEAIHVDWTGAAWGGLLKSRKDASLSNSTFLDGSANNTDRWWFAIGIYHLYNEQGATSLLKTGIPGPNFSNGNHYIVQNVDLYVRLDDENIGMNIIEKHGALWAEVFYHNNQNGSVFFNDAKEALHCTSKDKFSRLDMLERFRGKDNKFEFLLEYPEDVPNQYNRWKQTDNPSTTKEIIGTHYANGYEPIHIDWIGVYWGGLLMNSVDNNHTLINGSIGAGQWYYAIGAYVAWDPTGSGKYLYVPGPVDNDTDNNQYGIPNTIHLYVRIDNLENEYEIFKLLKTGTIKTKNIREV